MALRFTGPFLPILIFLTLKKKYSSKDLRYKFKTTSSLAGRKVASLALAKGFPLPRMQ